MQPITRTHDGGPGDHDAYDAVPFEEGGTPIPDWILHHPDVGDRALMMWAQLMSHHQKTGGRRMTRRELAKVCRCSIDTVDRHVRDLRHVGAVSSEPYDPYEDEGHEVGPLDTDDFSSRLTVREDHRTRARRFKVEYEPIVPFDVYERDGWICGICHEPVDPTLGWSDQMAVSLDHIVPLSRGGGHVWNNVQCAHKRCNSRKGTRIAWSQNTKRATAPVPLAEAARTKPHRTPQPPATLTEGSSRPATHRQHKTRAASTLSSTGRGG